MKNTYHSLIFLCFATACATFAPHSRAERADRDKPLNYEADTGRSDNLKQITNLKGNVVITKGSILIRAATVELRQDPDGYQSATITGTPQVPAFFRQKRDGVDEFFEGDSQLIEYDGRTDTVKLSGQAVLRRLRGTALADETSGETVVYNNLTDTVSVDGKPAKLGSGTAPGRIRGMFTPKAETSTARETSTKSPVMSEPALRATPSLGGGGK